MSSPTMSTNAATIRIASFAMRWGQIVRVARRVTPGAGDHGNYRRPACAGSGPDRRSCGNAPSRVAGGDGEDTWAVLEDLRAMLRLRLEHFDRGAALAAELPR